MNWTKNIGTHEKYLDEESIHFPHHIVLPQPPYVRYDRNRCNILSRSGAKRPLSRPP
jgi:hypothetical protein